MFTRGGTGREFEVYLIGESGAESMGVELEHPAHWPADAKVDAHDEKIVTRVRLVFMSASGGMFYCPDLADPDADFPRNYGHANKPPPGTRENAPSSPTEPDAQRH
jgi:hypothetical protein